MKISESAQEQLELLWIASEETDPRPTQAENGSTNYEELVQLSLVKPNGRGYVLTETGRAEAAMAIRRHRLAERLMVDVLATEEHLVEQRACGMEHALFDGVDESVCTLLGHPRFCPHGKPIPPGKCCQQMRNHIERLIASLDELKPGEGGKISYIQMNDAQHLQKLMVMGVLPGIEVKMLSNFPSFVFQAAYSQFAVDEALARDIYVRISPEKRV